MLRKVAFSLIKALPALPLIKALQSEEMEEGKPKPKPKKEQNMNRFTPTVKQKCWEAAPTVLGRDPKRWRKDILGATVCRDIDGSTMGVCAWQADHIKPPPKKPLVPHLNTVDNCQVLLSTANAGKRDKLLSLEVLSGYMHSLEFGDSEFDLIEMAIYGNVTDELGQKKCKCYRENELHGLKAGSILPCEIPIDSYRRELRETFVQMPPTDPELKTDHYLKEGCGPCGQAPGTLKKMIGKLNDRRKRKD